MTPTEINEAIAKSMGWHAFEANPKGQQFGWMPCHPEWDGPQYHAVPDYYNDLNAMHAAVLSLKGREQSIFMSELKSIVFDKGLNRNMFVEFQLQVASAQQLAEAYLRVKGLWV